MASLPDHILTRRIRKCNLQKSAFRLAESTGPFTLGGVCHAQRRVGVCEREKERMNPSQLPRTTFAVRIFEHGGPEKLQYGEYPLAEMGPRDVMVKVAAASVTYWDVKYRIGPHPGTPPGLFPLPQQLGREAAGEVIGVGAEVQRVEIGDRVVGAVHPADPYSDEAVRGVGNLSQMKMPGHQVLGSYAQYLVRDQTEWLPVPASLSLEEAAVTVWSFATAHRVIVDRLEVKLGDTVLIAGASGGMGQATVQLAKLVGGRVIATTRFEEKTASLRDVGADEVIVAKDLDLANEVRALTGGHGVDHAIDYTGDHDLLRSIGRALRPGGKILISSGEGSSDPVPFRPAQFLVQEMSVLGIRGARANDARMALMLACQGKIHTRIADRFPLSEARAAHERLETARNLTGRIVLLP